VVVAVADEVHPLCLSMMPLSIAVLILNNGKQL